MDKDDSKSRGMKHRTNKRKYNKNKASVHVQAPKPKVALESNWDRYELKEVDDKVNSSTDFSVLASAPITHGSHFQFKSDKDILEISEPVTTSLFKLDLTLLEKSLSTIPFNVRSGISKDIFSESQQRVMTALDDNINDYNAYVESHQSKKPDVVFGSDDDAADESSSGDSDVEAPQSPKTSVRQPPPADLEQWLDDILDD